MLFLSFLFVARPFPGSIWVLLAAADHHTAIIHANALLSVDFLVRERERRISLDIVVRKDVVLECQQIKRRQAGTGEDTGWNVHAYLRICMHCLHIHTLDTGH